jgi:hypothetical protein
MQILFFSHAGPMIRYGDGVLHVADLNPEMQTRWTMSRWEMLQLGWRCVLAAVM